MPIIKIQLKDGSWLFGRHDTRTNEMVLPSGYRMPIENGQVFYMGDWYTIQEGTA